MDASDLVGKLGEALFPWGGVAVAAGTILGTVAAADASGPKITSTLDADCAGGALDLSCYDRSVSAGGHESVLGSWVPDWWVGMEAAAAGLVGALLVLAVLAVLAVIRSEQERSQPRA
jgi:hypothetical protein